MWTRRGRRTQRVPRVLPGLTPPVPCRRGFLFPSWQSRIVLVVVWPTVSIGHPAMDVMAESLTNQTSVLEVTCRRKGDGFRPGLFHWNHQVRIGRVGEHDIWL